MKSNIKNSGNAISQLYEQIDDYILSLHSISDNSKKRYSALLKVFVRYLTDRGILSFNDVKRTDIGQFLSTKRKPNTLTNPEKVGDSCPDFEDAMDSLRLKADAIRGTLA